MTTLVTNLEVAVTEVRSRKGLLSLRSSHADVSAYNKLALDLALGESKTLVCSRFAYLHIRDTVTLTITTDAGSLVIPNATGSWAFPIEVTLELEVPVGSPITLNRVIDVVYG